MTTQTTLTGTQATAHLRGECGPDCAACRREVADLDRAFVDFILEQPHVYRTCLALARRWVAAGHGRLGISSLWERMRWELGVKTGSSPELNNSFRSRMARLLMARHPELEGLFETRQASVDMDWILGQLEGRI